MYLTRLNKKSIPCKEIRIKIHLLSALLHQQVVMGKTVEIDLPRFVEIICHDLSRLLNTRCSINIFNQQLAAVNDSVYCYGIPDLSIYDPTSTFDREEARKIIQHAIEIHEPRLSNVYVSTLINSQQQVSSTLDYRIEAEVILLKPKLHIALNSVVVSDGAKTSIQIEPEVVYAS